MLDKYQMLILGVLFFLGTPALIMFFEFRKGNPLYEEIQMYLPFNKLFLLAAIVSLGFCLSIIGTTLILGRY